METLITASQKWMHLAMIFGFPQTASYHLNPASKASQQPMYPSTAPLMYCSGDDEEKAKLEAEVAAFDTEEYWATHDQLLSVMLHRNKAQNAAPPEPTPIYNMYEDYASGRHLSETVAKFLTRLPPRSTPVSQHGPWIYIASPHYRDVPTSEDLAGFRQVGHRLLDEYTEKKERIEDSMAGKAKNTIERKLTPDRKKLEADIHKTARDKGIKSGKWMLFVSADRINEVWALVANAVAEDELGHAAKVGVDEGSGDKKARLICVYTQDCADQEDVKRVLQRLDGLGLVASAGNPRGIYYKADCYTYLDIMSGNEWGLKPTLYSSADLMKKGKK